MSKRTQRKRKITRHHILPKNRGGGNEPWNILRIKRERHDMWHTLFRSMTLEEARDLLDRTIRMKNALKHRGY
jgi:hypothetical protein